MLHLSQTCHLLCVFQRWKLPAGQELCRVAWQEELPWQEICNMLLLPPNCNLHGASGFAAALLFAPRKEKIWWEALSNPVSFKARSWLEESGDWLKSSDQACWGATLIELRSTVIPKYIVLSIIDTPEQSWSNWEWAYYLNSLEQTRQSRTACRSTVNNQVYQVVEKRWLMSGWPSRHTKTHKQTMLNLSF